MSFTKITSSQNSFLERHLRGTGRSLTSRQALSLYGIKNLRARMSEFRQSGLVVRAKPNKQGRVAYQVSARDWAGSRATHFTV